MRRLTLLSFVAALSGCGAGAASAPEPATPDARTSRNQKREEPVKLIAPPPAYGNKIVMTERSPLRTPGAID